MNIRLLAFGIARDIIGQRESLIDVPDSCTTDTLRLQIDDTYPALKNIAVYALALNETYVIGDVLLNENDLVAIIPPVSGG